MRTVDGVVHPLVELIDLLAEGLGIEVDLSLIRRELVIERCVEHADDLGALVVHNCLLLLVPEHGHGESQRRITSDPRLHHEFRHICNSPAIVVGLRL